MLKNLKIEDSLGNLGCNGNYFYLLESIQADYYMFCNADDFWIKDKIKISIERMRYVERKYSNTVPIIIHTDLAITDKALNTIYDSLWNYDNINPKEMYTYNRVGVCNTIAGATMLFNEATKKITFPVSTFAPFFDHWMALKVVQAGGIIEPIYTSTVLYRQIGTNLAAINMGNTNTIVYKIKNIRSVFLKNFNEAKMLKNIGWGGYLKYIFFKFQIFLKLRFTRK